LARSAWPWPASWRWATVPSALRLGCLTLILVGIVGLKIVEG
jgi:hypothetical protein